MAGETSQLEDWAEILIYCVTGRSIKELAAQVDRRAARKLRPWGLMLSAAGRPFKRAIRGIK